MFELICDVLQENARNGILPTHIGDMSLMPQMSMSDLGLDSLGKLTVLSELCGRLGIPQVDMDLHEHISLDEFGHLLRRASEEYAGATRSGSVLEAVRQ
jgi:acyl carrier protein